MATGGWLRWRNDATDELQRWLPVNQRDSALSLPRIVPEFCRQWADRWQGFVFVATVFDVLQTLLAGTPDARIAVEPKTKSIVAWARPETHQIIAKSIAEMEGSGQEFKVIDLKRLDPAQALLTINKFFGVTEEGGDGPIVDGDPATGKLWIRGTADQIAKVEKLLANNEISLEYNFIQRISVLLPVSCGLEYL